MTFWSKTFFILLKVSAANPLKRQISGIPPGCSNVCDNTQTVAQEIGKVPALCIANGPFEQALAVCTECIIYSPDLPGSGTGPVVSDPVPSTIISPDLPGIGTGPVVSNPVPSTINLNPYIDYCNLKPAQSVLSSAASVAASVSSAVSSLVAQSRSLCYSLASQSLTPTAACTSATAAPITTTLLLATHSPTNSATSHPRANTGNIVGAAIGSAAGSLIIIVCILCGLRKRKHRKALAAADLSPEKAQLHSDDYKPVRKELLGTLGKKQYDHTEMSELPSNEPVEKSKELPANEEVGAELDNQVKISETKESSQSTKVGSGHDG